MSESDSPPAKGGIITLILIVLLLVFIAWPRLSGGIPAWRFISLNNLRQIAPLLIQHAGANGGQLPPTLAQLSPTLIAPADLPKLGFQGPDSKQLYAWLYFPRPSIFNIPPETILAASPITFSTGGADQKRMVLHLDGSVTIIPETEFQSAIAQQMKGDP